MRQPDVPPLVEAAQQLAAARLRRIAHAHPPPRCEECREIYADEVAAREHARRVVRGEHRGMV